MPLSCESLYRFAAMECPSEATLPPGEIRPIVRIGVRARLANCDSLQRMVHRLTASETLADEESLRQCI